MLKSSNRLFLQIVGLSLLISALTFSPALAQDDEVEAPPGFEIMLPNSTQGPVWPPSEMVDEDGNFILIGSVLTEVTPGNIMMMPGQAVLVSKETTPPLDENGVEDADNWFGGTHDVIRRLDLSFCSPDLDMVLYANSFGPPAGEFGRAPRIPMLGESTYNLNGDLAVCADVFPSESQKFTYMRPKYPLHKVPIFGFQGDQVALDPDTGGTFDPMTRTTTECDGCSGEDIMDQRRTNPITLREWLNQKAKLKVWLTRKDEVHGEYTHAKFKFDLHDMLPNSLFTVWVVRPRQFPVPGLHERRDIDPIALPNLLATDSEGNASATFEVRNPFPASDVDFEGRRIIGLSIVYHSDQQTWGACFSRLGPGVDIHVCHNSMINGDMDFAAPLTTRAPSSVKSVTQTNTVTH